ncbi:golgin subfamily B member 1 isoform X9 [Nasonia vitripennis]|uniref:Uncharacterized protein n=1 Tax=Nasonia vitripennis TaxID=7425 RepID=A0A7M7QAA6_NASVI|nr:golgin subfamily B member 1 isoform X9 [Nasonia vitripennis]
MYRQGIPEEHTAEPSDDVVDDISQAKTPKAKSSLLQKKLAEDRKIFEQRSKELTESKRAVEEKVEALRQQLEERYVAPVSVVSPVLVTSQGAHPVMELSHVQDKDNKITELSNKIFELEAVIIDLQENLKEKDSVIDSKTKAITLMSADLSMKGKTTLDTLEDTKDEMRSMQENFVLVESSLKSKNDNLLKQLEEKAEQIATLEENVQSLTEKLEAQKQAETVSADFSRSTMDTLADTKDAMKSMQENFVLIETSLKSKNEHLLKQLEEREIKLAESEARILNLETGLGIERQPNVEEITYKVDKLEEMNRKLQDEKYELQKNIAELQDKIISTESRTDESIMEDNRIAELESLIEELKKSNQHLEEEYKAALHNQVAEMNERNETLSNKIVELEKQVNDVTNDKIELESKLSAIETEAPKEDEQVQKLTKELEELNKSMIKLKAQHKNKLKNLQKQLENFKKVSDKNAELVKLGNQVALLEEEKGNLQLSLVDFDELKASAGDWKERIADLEGKVASQAKEIETHIEAIAILENQKLDLMQELHAVKQEVSSLEAENAESENLRVTAEMKVVDLEEEIESLHKQQQAEPLTDAERIEFQRQIENLTQENERLSQKVSKLEELKSSSEVGSTESFVKTGSNVDSTESFEAFAADADKADLLRKIDGLTRENGALLEKLTRFEEKGSSDTGSTESFERIPEHGESTSRLENLTRENYELVVKLTKLEEKLAASEADTKLQEVLQENERLVAKLKQLEENAVVEEVVREKRSVEVEEVPRTQEPEIEETSSEAPTEVLVESTESPPHIVDELVAKIEELKSSLEAIGREKEELAAKLKEKEPVAQELQVEETIVPAEASVVKSSAQQDPSEAELKSDAVQSEAIAALEREIERCTALIAEQKAVIEDLKTKLADKEEELERKSAQLASSESHDQDQLDAHVLRRELEESASEIAEWKHKCAEMEEKMKVLEKGRQHIEEGFQALQTENKNLLEQSEHKDVMLSQLKEELDHTISDFEAKSRAQGEVIASQEQLVEELRKNVEEKDLELQGKYSQLQNDLIKMDELQDKLARLEAQVQQRDATIASLTEEVETLRTNASVVEEDLFMARHQLTDLHEKLKDSKSLEEYNQLMEQLNDKTMLVEELETKLSQKLAEVNALKAQVESLVSENHQLREQFQVDERRIADLLDDNHNQEEALRSSERAKADVENRLLDLQDVHEENLRHAKNVTTELQNSYKMIEQLKIKHTEDMDMLNRRLEDVIEELELKSQEITSMQNELEEKTALVSKSMSEEVKLGLETQLAELSTKLTEAEDKAHAQLEKMKKYAAVAKKKTAQCEELETKLRELEESLNLEKIEKELRNRELHEAIAGHQEKDNRIVEMDEELRRIQVERDEAVQNVEAIKQELRQATDKLSTMNEEMQELSEAKDNARELGVRMQVIEAEYIDQLAQINSLRAENGILLSKQTQINERLENVEKESEERRAQLEKYEKQKEIEETQRAEAAVQQAQTCGECASKVQALEAKLQERDAEIENLDNELHNSIGNLVQMQENLRLSTIPAAPDASMQESYNELMLQYNVLTATNEEMKAKYEATLHENEELLERVARLQELNVTMQERIESVERELARDKEVAASFDETHQQYQELREKYEQQRSELETAQSKLREAIASSEASERNLQSTIELLQHEKEQLEEENKNLKIVKDNNILLDDSWGDDASSSMINVEAQPQIRPEPVTETMERHKREVDQAAVPVSEESSQPPLFDASIFGASPPQPSSSKNAQLEFEMGLLRDEVSVLRNQLDQARSATEEVQARMGNEIQETRATIDQLTEQLTSLNAQREDLARLASDREAELKALHDQFAASNQAILQSRSEYEQLVGKLEQLQSANHELSAAEEVYKNRVHELETELRTSGDNARIAELENRLARITSERDILQLQVNDSTRAFEDLKEESMQGLKQLQARIETLIQEKNQLTQELETLRVAKPEAVSEQFVQAATAPVAETVPAPKLEAAAMGDSMWEDDEDPWGLSDKTIPHSVEQHVDIPMVLSAETQLKLQVDELEEKLRELTEENAKLIEEGKVAQVKNVKYVKKLKEYKVQFDSLQRQLKSQKSMGGFGDLDSAIEEELKSQVDALEKALTESKAETKKIAAEKEKLLNRIDVLTAATERFTEAKEKQDTEVHIWQMRYKELEMKLQQLDFGPETKDSTTSPPQERAERDPKYEEELKELKDSVEALAAENEELQQLLEENRTKRQTSVEESSKKTNELEAKNVELLSNNEKLKGDYETLRKQYEQSLMDANDQVQSMRQNCELIKAEYVEKTSEHDKTVAELNERLQTVLEEKTQLEGKVQGLESEVERINNATTYTDELSELLNARVQEVAGLKEELQRLLQDKTQLEENTRATIQQLTEELHDKQDKFDALNTAIAEKDGEILRQAAELEELRGLVDKVNGLELSIEGYTTQVQEQNEELETLRDKLRQYEVALTEKEQQVSSQQSQLQQSLSETQQCNTQVQEQHELAQRLAVAETHVAELTQRLSEAENHIQNLNSALSEKEAHLAQDGEESRRLQDELQVKEAELAEVKSKLEAAVQAQEQAASQVRKEISSIQQQPSVKVIDELPVFTFGSDNDDKELQNLRAELRAKNEEIEHLQYAINESQTTRIIQELQDNINALYNEKAELESQVISKNQEINGLKFQLDELRSHQHQPVKRSAEDQEELFKLQNELHIRDQELNELRYVVTEKESQLREALEQASGNAEQHESVEKLKSDLYEKQQELENLKFTVSDLQSEVANLRGLERLAGEDRATIERLSSEKEEVRREAQEAVERVLREKEQEIDNLKQQLAAENQSLMEALGLRERDIENLKLQIEQTGLDRDSQLDQRADQVAHLEAELSERDRRLAELSITKDTEIHNIRVQLSEKNARFEELVALTEEEERQLSEMRKLLEVKEQQINGLTQQLDEKSKEYELMQHALQRHVTKSDQSTEITQQQLEQSASSAAAMDAASSSSANELDLALYMLHQRDVRCEELTHELMQLLEERDTLQLRLSNAIRVNEELRKYAAAAGSSPKKDSPKAQESDDSQDVQPLIQDPSPSKSEGPVEIAKEAINSPIGEDKKALAQKLSQLRGVDQARDVRLRDDRELRHSQQMSLLVHGDVLSKLPPEAAARLVNANHTLSREVQSQSSVLMNWLWGKSTPKVVHM